MAIKKLMTPKLMTPADVAEYLDESVHLVRRLMSEGGLPCRWHSPRVGRVPFGVLRQFLEYGAEGIPQEYLQTKREQLALRANETN